jgi:hypothetical protein
MAAFADSAAAVQRLSAFGAFHCPRLRSRLLLPGFDGLGCLEPGESRLIGLLHCALRVYAANGIGRLAANRTKIPWWLGYNDDQLFGAHDALKIESYVATP